jgi:hypothetical protein
MVFLTFSANSGNHLQSSFLCNQTKPNCTNGFNPHADAAHKYAIGTHNLYATKHSRDSIDNNGMPIISTVQYCEPGFSCPYANAFWDGTQMVYGSAYGFALADDIVAHELTHGVIQYESNLFYYYQSGAINESFADLWGEYYDQTNGLGNDTAGVKWLIGEDITGLGAIRSMSNPPLYGDPDRMSSTYYYEGEADSGGVHTNSGVNNKAVFLMVDGGTFNGKTVSALGWEKTAAIYYEVNTSLLTSGADYSDLYYALQQACTNLIGTKGITSADCVEVKDALDAVEMNGQPAPNFNTDAPLCTTAGTYPNVFFADDLESGTSNWTFNNGSYLRWQLDSPYGPFAQSGLHSLYADDYPAAITDASARLTSFVVPANAFLHFAHYKGTIFSNWNNPLKGRSAFVGTSHGYISTRLNLASLAGKTVTFRWRMGLDDSGFAWGWWVDNVRAYTCVSSFTLSGNAGASGVTLSYTDSTAKTAISAADGSYTIKVPPNWSGTVTPTHPCYTFSPASRTYTSVTANQTAQNYTATFNPASGCANVNVNIGGTSMGNYGVPVGREERLYYPVSGGPVKVESTNAMDIVSAIRLQSFANNTLYSFVETMGVPGGLLSHRYYFPTYNNTWPPLNSQIRFGNLDASPTTIRVTIGGTVVWEQSVPGLEERRLYFPVSGGPVVIESLDTGKKIVAAIRLQSFANNTLYSFSETMGIPDQVLSHVYYFPTYNNTWAPLNSQLRFGNLDTNPTTIRVTIGGTVVWEQSVPGLEERRLTFPVSGGPVKVESLDVNKKIVAAIRLQSFANNTLYSFVETMGVPGGLLSHKYVFPTYNNTWPPLNSQIRFGNLDASPTTIRVTIGGVNVWEQSVPGLEERRLYFPVSGGPVVIESLDTGKKIVAAIRLQSFANNTLYSFSETMGIPAEQLSEIYYFPTYNNTWTPLNSQLRFGVP